MQKSREDAKGIKGYDTYYSVRRREIQLRNGYNLETDAAPIRLFSRCYLLDRENRAKVSRPRPVILRPQADTPPGHARTPSVERRVSGTRSPPPGILQPAPG